MHLPVEVSTFSIPSFARADLRDLTPHGIAVHTDHTPHPYDDIEVSLHIPCEISLEKKVIVRFRGEIVRVMNKSVDGSHGFAAILHPLRSTFD